MLATALMAVASQATRAFPDGAPWGAANPEATQNCAACHFDGEPTRNSASLVIDGLPEYLSPDTLYDLVVRFDNPGGLAAGFQMFAGAGNQPAGTFTSDAVDTETVGAAIRSTAPMVKQGPVSWAVRWHTPASIDAVLNIYVAASSANDDQSPFGDNIHFRSYLYVNGSARKIL